MAPRWVAAALLGLLVVGAGCTPEPGPAPSPSITGSTREASPSPSLSPGSSSAAPSAASSAAPSAAPMQTPSARTEPTPSTPVESTVPPRPEPSKTPVKLDRRSATGTGLTARLVTVRSVEAEAGRPGETSGPALAVTVEVTNTGSKAADLDEVVVNLVDEDEAPGTEITSAPAEPLTGSVAAGEKARGIYVFRVAEDKRRPVTVTVSIGTAPVLVFTGWAPS